MSPSAGLTLGKHMLRMKLKALMFAMAALLSVEPAAAQVDDWTAVKVAAAELAVVNAGAAYGNLTLPTDINGATVTWASGNEKLVTASGEVTRPKGRDARVVLHATITKGAATASRDITIRVVKAFKKAAEQAYLFVHFTFSDEQILFYVATRNTALVQIAVPIVRLCYDPELLPTARYGRVSDLLAAEHMLFTSRRGAG